MKVDTENIFYVHLSEPVEIRKSILESSRQAVRLLQRYESIIELRVKKTEQINNLRKNFRELTLLINKLKQEMPKVNVRVKSKEEFISSPPKSAEHKKKAAASKKEIGIQHLQQELRDIEAKLGRLK